MSSHGTPTGQPTPVQTDEVPVRAFVRNGAVIEGHAHVMPGGYQGRVSDVLNRGNMRYLPITHSVYTAPNEEARHSECVLVNVDDIVMLDVAPDTPPSNPAS